MESQTQCSTLQAWHLSGITDTPTTLFHIWDLGGQLDYQPPNSLCLTDQALYILVWDARSFSGLFELKSWLDILVEKAPHSAVIIVQNKCDQSKQVLPKTDLKKAYPFIHAFVDTSVLENNGLATLKKTILSGSISICAQERSYPTIWDKVRQGLIKHEKSPMMSVSDFLAFAITYGLSLEQANDLLAYLHRVGYILHLHSGMLNPWVLLRPDLIADLFNVLNRYNTFYSCRGQKSGIAFCHLLPLQLSSSLPPNRGPTIVFKWIYPPIWSRHYPALVIAGKLSAWMEFSNITQHTVTLNYQTTSTMAIFNDVETRTLTLTCAGPHHIELAHLARITIDAVLSEKLPADALFLQCPCAHCSTAATPFWFDYSRIELYRAHHRDTIVCEYSFQDLPIASFYGTSGINAEKHYFDEKLSAFSRKMALTTQETTVLATLFQLGDDDHLAKALYISKSTLRNHVQSIFNKTNTNKRTDLILKILYWTKSIQ